MNQLSILVKREFWEHRNTFVVLPAVISAFFILVMVSLFLASDIGGISAHISIDGDNGSEEWRLDAEDASISDGIGFLFSGLPNMSTEERELQMYKIYHSLSLPFFIVLTFVVFFYLIGSLYEDRKDRSILFWKSLPVSDTHTVLAKLATALVAVPAVYLVFSGVVQLSLLLVASIAALGHDTPIFEMLWAPSNLVGRWFVDIAYLLLQGVWGLPFYGWVMLVSAFAKSVPLAWCIGIPIGVSVVERLFTQGSGMTTWLVHHATPTPYSADRVLSLSDITRHLVNLDTLIGVVVGAAFITAAIWMRGKADEI